MNMDDTISKINSIDPIALEDRLRIKSPQEKPIWNIPIECIPDPKKVWLTVNQAKELATKLKNNADFFFLQTGEFDYDTDELWQCLTEKIEQAEDAK